MEDLTPVSDKINDAIKLDNMSENRERESQRERGRQQLIKTDVLISC